MGFVSNKITLSPLKADVFKWVISTVSSDFLGYIIVLPEFITGVCFIHYRLAEFPSNPLHYKVISLGNCTR